MVYLKNQKGTKKQNTTNRLLLGFLLCGWLGDLCVSLFSLFRAPQKVHVEVPDDSWGVNGSSLVKIQAWNQTIPRHKNTKNFTNKQVRKEKQESPCFPKKGGVAFTNY